MKIVAVAGKYDPVHDGHINHIIEASKLGDFLVIITHNDYSVRKFSSKNQCFVPIWARVKLLQGILYAYNIHGKVVIAEEITGDAFPVNSYCDKALEIIKPDIFAKGGDRTQANMVKEEIDICKKINCQIVYGIGELLNSSSNIIKHMKE